MDHAEEEGGGIRDMMNESKIYSDDDLLKYKDTEIHASRTKAQIDGVLAEYGIQDVYWHWNKEAVEKNESAEVYVMFKIEEVVNGFPVKVGVRVDCPIIWNRRKPLGRPPRPEEVNWNVSLRAMYHFIYTHLNSGYVMKSSKTLAFLGYIQSGKDKQLKDIIIPRLSEYQALENQTSGTRKEHIIDAELVKDESR